jgi:non-heme chloroperoxidase
VTGPRPSAKISALAGRRAFLSAGLASATLPLVAACAHNIANAARPSNETLLTPDDPATIPAPPPLVTPGEGLAQVPGGKLWYWDTGGSGQTIVLLHANTGSALAWPYQQQVFSAAGYRVIAYSRRGAYGSQTDPGGPTFSAQDDLNAFVNALSLDRFHLIGTAAGGFAVTSYTLAHPERVCSATISCSLAGIRDDRMAAVTNAIRPQGFGAMPPEFRELSPSYRAANPDGVKRWLEIEKGSAAALSAAETPAREAPAGPTGVSGVATSLDDLKQLKPPVHLIYGDADLYAPPAIARMLATQISDCQLSIVGEAGHSAYWEQPGVFNKAVLAFLRKYRDR